MSDDKATLWAANQTELSIHLGVNRRTISRWRQIDGNPGAESDGRLNVEAWREWAKSQGHEFEPSSGKAEIEKKILLTKHELLLLALKRERGQVTDNDKLEVWVAEMVGAAKTVLLGLPGSLAPQVVGLSIPEAQRRIRESIDEALTQLYREPWKEQQEAPTQTSTSNTPN